MRGCSHARNTVLTDLRSGAGTAVRDVDGGLAPDPAWAIAWAAQVREELTDLKAQAAALADRPPRPPLPSGIDPADPEVRRVLARIAGADRLVAERVAEVEALSERIIALTLRAAGGDSQAARALAVRRLEIEIVFEQAVADQADVVLFDLDDPFTDTTFARVHLSRASIALIRAAIDEPDGKIVDRTALKAELLAHAQGIDAANAARERHARIPRPAEVPTSEGERQMLAILAGTASRAGDDLRRASAALRSRAALAGDRSSTAATWIKLADADMKPWQYHSRPGGL